MAVTVSARLSTDAGNGLTFGSDTGLYGALPGGVVRGGAQAWTVDNSWGTATGVPYFYYLGMTSSAVAAVAGTAYVWPLVLSRAARFTALSAYVSSAAANSGLYHAVYASDPVTGNPAAKLTDLGFSAATVAGPAAHTMTDTTTVWQPYTLYWVASWISTTSAVPTLYMRSIAAAGSIRLTVAPTGVAWFNAPGALSLLDTTSGWAARTSGPGTLTIAANSATTAGQSAYAPQLALGLANA